MSKIIKRTAGVLAGILVSLLVVVFCLLFTSPGNQFLAYGAGKLVDGLSVELPQGRFLYNDPFSVRYHTDAQSIELHGLRLALAWSGCEGLCFDQIAAEQIVYRVEGETPQTVTNDDVQQASAETAPVVLPFPVDIRRIDIAGIDIGMPGQEIRLNRLTTALRMAESELIVPSFTLAEAQIHQEQAKETPPEPLAALPAITPVELSLPLTIDLRQAELSRFELWQGKRQTQAGPISLSAKAEERRAGIEKLSARYGQWQLAGSVSVTLGGGNRVAADLTLTDPQNRVTAQVNGPLSALDIAVESQGLYPLTLDASADLTREN